MEDLRSRVEYRIQLLTKSGTNSGTTRLVVSTARDIKFERNNIY